VSGVALSLLFTGMVKDGWLKGAPIVIENIIGGGMRIASMCPTTESNAIDVRVNDIERRLAMAWIERFPVTGTNGDCYIVARSDTGDWGCSCPAWTFAKKPKSPCKHQQMVFHNLENPKFAAAFKGVDLGPGSLKPMKQMGLLGARKISLEDE